MATRKGALVRVVDDTGGAQKVHVRGLFAEQLHGVEHMQPYGYTAHPEPAAGDGKGAECVLIDLNGATHRVVIVTGDRRFRPRTCAPGDVVLYTSADDPDAEHEDATSRVVLTTDPALIIRIGAARITAHQDHLQLQYGAATVTMSAGQIHFTAGG